VEIGIEPSNAHPGILPPLCGPIFQTWVVT
jgi:hypothetical protein